MESKTVQFAVRDNNNLHKLELAKALLHTIEFDFTYFWEKCIEAGRAAKKSGRLPLDMVSSAKNIITGFHPYVEALIGSDFSEIVTDCIIEYICHSERITTDELWGRCISPKNLYEEAIFKRISEYKTDRAINQWGNIVRIQEYAKNKVSFIYDCGQDIIPQSKEAIHIRKEYFDLAFSVAANELGIQGSKLPSVRVASPALTPNAHFINAKTSKEIYRRFAEVLRLGGDMSVPEAKDCSRIGDKLAMEAYSYVRGMKRPDELDMKFISSALKFSAEPVYMPDSFKAVIDLEFDLMEENNIMLRKCESCGRYFIADGDSFYCNRVTSSGHTCREQYAAVYKAAAEAAEKSVIKAAAERRGQDVPEDIEKRSRKIYNILSKRVGKTMDDKEFDEWSKYLSDMKRNIKLGEASVEQLTEFLDYSDTLCGEDNGGEEKTAQGFQAFVPKERYTSDGDNIHIVYRHDEDNAPQQNNAQQNVPRGVTRVVSADDARIKPFRPQEFESVYDAFMAEHTTADSADASPEKPKKKQVEIKAPQWKRMTRAEAYGLTDDSEGKV